jgi:signal peptidase I
MNTFLLVGLFLLAVLALQASVIWLATRICRLERRSWWRAAALVIIKVPLGAGLSALINTVDWPNDWIRAVVLLLADALLTVWLLRRLFGGSRQRAIATWAVQLIAGVVLVLGLVYATKPVLDAFVWPGSSMTPNIRGYHVVELLPDGNHLIIAANDPNDPHGIPAGAPSGAIVAETHEYREVPRPAKYTQSPDRFICNKTKFPARWDAIVFKHPENPELMYVKRLVGLPGERIEIRDDAAWVNGERLSPPARLGPIRYVSGQGPPGVEAPPFEVMLGPDEYLVLGDNTNRSADSRHFGPVKRELIVGVADLIYWPPARWQVRP